MRIRVAGAQMPVTRDISANEAAIVAAIDWASKAGADILLTPEGSLSGYTHEFDASAVADALERVTSHAREASIALALGTCFIEPEGQCYNQLRFYDRDGEYLGFHSKTLRCGTLTDPPEGELNHYAVSPLRVFDFGGIRIGGLICNDLWATPGYTPQADTHLTQQMAEMGARVILHAVNGERGPQGGDHLFWMYHEANLLLRARASKLWVVTVDNCHPTNLHCSSPSGVVAPDGTWACLAEPVGLQYFLHTIDLDDASAEGFDG